MHPARDAGRDLCHALSLVGTDTPPQTWANETQSDQPPSMIAQCPVSHIPMHVPSSLSVVVKVVYRHICHVPPHMRNQQAVAALHERAHLSCQLAYMHNSPSRGLIERHPRSIEPPQLSCPCDLQPWPGGKLFSPVNCCHSKSGSRTCAA